MADENRREFMKRAASIGLTTGMAAQLGASHDINQENERSANMGSSDKRPNILWIQTDEQRPDSLGCYGAPWAHSPNLDALAARGSTFHECHVQSPVCVPSRTSMLFCKYPMQMNIYNNDSAFKDGFIDPEAVAFPNLFERAGYRTVSYGKWHTGNHPTFQENTLFHIFGKISGYYGMTPPYREEDYDVIQLPGMWKIILAGRYPYHDWGVTISNHVTDWGVQWLQENGHSDQPWLLRISHMWPHTPVLVPEPWDKMLDLDDVPCNALNREAYETRAAYDRWFADEQKGFDLTMDQWRQICRDYYALCAHVDHEIGRLIRALDDLGLMENTIIAFNADHGRSNGETGLSQKGTYDREVWRVPFILAGPGIPEGQDRHDLMELMDFGPTLCALAGVDMEEDMLGRSLFDSDEPEAVFGVIDLAAYRRVGVRTRQYRFDCTVRYQNENVSRENADPNLFDVIEDPHETRNLIHDSAMAPLANELYDRVIHWYQNNQ